MRFRPDLELKGGFLFIIPRYWPKSIVQKDVILRSNHLNIFPISRDWIHQTTSEDDEKAKPIGTSLSVKTKFAYETIITLLNL